MPMESKDTTSKKRGTGKVSRQAKENIQAVFVRLGGTAAMARWAKKNLGEFYTKIYARMIPHEMTGPDGKDLFGKVERVILK